MYVSKVAMCEKARGFKLYVTYANFTCIYTDQQQSKFTVFYLATDGTVGDFLYNLFLSIFCCTFSGDL